MRKISCSRNYHIYHALVCSLFQVNVSQNEQLVTYLNYSTQLYHWPNRENGKLRLFRRKALLTSLARCIVSWATVPCSFTAKGNIAYTKPALVSYLWSAKFPGLIRLWDSTVIFEANWCSFRWILMWVKRQIYNGLNQMNKRNAPTLTFRVWWETQCKYEPMGECIIMEEGTIVQFRISQEHLRLMGPRKWHKTSTFSSLFTVLIQE